MQRAFGRVARVKLFRGTVAHVLFSRMRTSGFSFDVEVVMMARRLNGQYAAPHLTPWIRADAGRPVRLAS